MLRFLNKNKSAPPDFSQLGADMHAHWLPGIDDGAPDLETSLALIQGLQSLGYQKLIATPHVMAGMYPNTREGILQKLEEVQTFCLKSDRQLPQLGAAAEYFLDDHFVELVKKEPLLTLPGGYVLIEMALFQEYPGLHAVLFELQMKGYKPVMAHPERYLYYHTLEDFERLREMGCALQVNLLSLSGYYNKSAKTDARLLITHGLVDFLGTDLHHLRHLENLQQSLSGEWVEKAIGQAAGNRRLL
jgi:protein-tyrosine phosphatase